MKIRIAYETDIATNKQTKIVIRYKEITIEKLTGLGRRSRQERSAFCGRRKRFMMWRERESSQSPSDLRTNWELRDDNRNYTTKEHKGHY